MATTMMSRLRVCALVALLMTICSTQTALGFFPPPNPTGVNSGEVPPIVPPTPPDVFVPPTPPVIVPPTEPPAVQPQTTPEPATLVMGLIGCAVAGGTALRRKWSK